MGVVAVVPTFHNVGVYYNADVANRWNAMVANGGGIAISAEVSAFLQSAFSVLPSSQH